MRVCSPEWLAAARAAVCELRVDDQLEGGLCQIIGDQSDGLFVRIGMVEGRVLLDIDGPRDNDIVLRTGLTTARSLSGGTQPAQQAVLAGDVRVSGDMARLVAMSDAMSEISEALRPVWADTDI